MPDLFADAAGADGINVNTENYSADPQFRDPQNGDFSITRNSPAYATGDTTLDLVGSIISDTYAGSDITFTSETSNQNSGVEISALRKRIDTSIANGSTVSRNSSILQTFDVASPSLGAFEVFHNSNGSLVNGTPADIAGSEQNPSLISTGLTEINNNRVVIVFRSDDIDEGVTQDSAIAASSEDRILVDSNNSFKVEFDTEGAVRTDKDGNITNDGTHVFTDERTNTDNSETRNVTTSAIIGNSMPPPTITTISGLEVKRTRRGSGIEKCPKEIPLIGTDYNLNTLICISEQYDRNIINVPFGLGIGWAQGPPAIRLRGKNVYRVLNNSPSTDYVK